MPKTNTLLSFSIREEKNGVIKLTEVPDIGATACINADYFSDPSAIPYTIKVLIAGKEVAQADGVTPVDKLPLEILVPKVELLNNVGPEGVEFMCSLSIGGNSDSKTVTYEIRHF